MGYFILLYYERQIAREIAFTLPMFSDHSRGFNIKFNFRCHICGDSKKDQYAARGWFFEYNNHVWYGCFNCSKRFPMIAYLKNFHDSRYIEYIKEKYRDTDQQKKPEIIQKPIVNDDIIIPELKLEYCTRLDFLNENHPCIKWVNNRCIPEYNYDRFYFTNEWRKLSNIIKPETYSNDQSEYRLVIPICNRDGSVSCIQGRALGNVEKSQRYLTVKPNEHANKIFGLERNDPNKTTYFLEGPIDSTFIDNSLAIVGGTMSLDVAPCPKTRVWVLDNEPRSPDTVNRLEKLIDAGEKVVVWVDCPWYSKDINDFIQKEGATIEQIVKYLEEHTVSGLNAKFLLTQWRKVK